MQPNAGQPTKAEKRLARKEAKEARQLARTPKPIVARTKSQQIYLTALEHSDQVFAIGPAGTGKTYIAARHGARLVDEGVRSKVYITRPVIAPPRHEIGFLPGGMDAKMSPWMVPIYDAIKDELGASGFERLKNSKAVEIAPFSFMRGRTFRDCTVIVDEAQNLTFEDFRLLLTRLGEDAQMLVNGDISQADIPNSGLERILDMIEDYDLDADTIEFMPSDVVRSKAARQWVEAFDRLVA